MAGFHLPLGIILAGIFTAVLLSIVYVYNDQNTADLPSAANSNGTRAVSTLQFVIVVARHGNRGPIATNVQPYPTSDRNVWPYGSSHLTNSGRDQLYALGKKVRSLYNGFLSETYYPQDVKAFSTLKERCLQSAEMFLAGLFPPRGFQMWDKNLLWQPVPVYPTYLEHTEYALIGSTECPRYQQEKRSAQASFLTENKDNITAVVDYLKPYMRMGDDWFYTFVLAWDFLTCAKNEGLPLPAWAHKVYPDALDYLTLQVYQMTIISSDTMKRLFQGQVFQEIVSMMQAKAGGSLNPDRRLYLYSGHDTTILGLLGILGLREAPVTRFVRTSSALVFELHRDPETAGHHVQVLYINGHSSDLEPALIHIPGCDYPCSLQLLMNITEKYYNFTDYQQECQLNNT